MNDQEKKKSELDEPAKPTEEAADVAADKPTDDISNTTTPQALKDLSAKSDQSTDAPSAEKSESEEPEDKPAEDAVEVAAPGPDITDVQELLENHVEKLRSQPSAADHLTWWERMIPGRKRDVQLAEIKSGYDEVLGLMRSMRENMDAQVVGQKKLVEFMSELPDVAKGLRHMGEAASQQKEIMGALKNQMESNVQQNASIATSMDKFSGTLHSMDDTTRQILQGARQTENSLKSLLERSERRLMIMTSLVILLLVAVGIGVVVMSNEPPVESEDQPQVADQLPPADESTSPVVEPIAPVVDEDPVLAANDEPEDDDENVEVVEEPGTGSLDESVPTITVTNSVIELDVPVDDAEPVDEASETIEVIQSEESDEAAPVEGSDDESTEDDDVESTQIEASSEIQEEPVEEAKPKKGWLRRNLFGKDKDSEDDDLDAESTSETIDTSGDEETLSDEKIQD